MADIGRKISRRRNTVSNSFAGTHRLRIPIKSGLKNEKIYQKKTQLDAKILKMLHGDCVCDAIVVVIFIAGLGFVIIEVRIMLVELNVNVGVVELTTG